MATRRGAERTRLALACLEAQRDAILGMASPLRRTDAKEAAEGRGRSVARRSGRLGLRIPLKRAAPPLGHELIELGAIPGDAQPRKEILELALLLFQAL
jgi:hypothetical protein